ncbi:Uncharacterised protein [uncultured archaeon]|nr:Uncharacterised protein [uncultured archaeon]
MLTATEIVYVIINVLLIIISLFLIIHIIKLRHKKESIKEEQINLSNIVDITAQEFKPEWFEMNSHDAEPAKPPDPGAVPMTGSQAVSGELNMRSDLKLEDDLTEFNENIEEEIPIHAETDVNEGIPENPIDAEIKKQLIAFTAGMDVNEHEATESSAEIKEQLNELTAGKKTTGKRKAVKKNSRRKKK